MLKKLIKELNNILIFKNENRYDFYYITFLIIIGSILEVFGVALIVPLVTLILSENIIENFPFFLPIIDLIGNPSKFELLVIFSIFFIIFFFLNL